MHPAPSIIVFTTLSGLGFGLMVWLGLLPGDRGSAGAFFVACLALGLASVGLLASLLHLGHPERAWKALSQWQSSWLSREGVAAVATLGAFSIYAAGWVLTGQPVAWLGLLSAGLAVVTIASTAMIYAQLKTVPRWHSPLTPLLFLLYALAGGALLAGLSGAAAWLLLAAGAAQLAAWHVGDTAFARSGSTLGTATGLGTLGALRQLEPPHTGSNYLLREMVFVIGRKHGRRLRIAALVLAIALPLVVALISDLPPPVAIVLAMLHGSGVLVSRWLFFAEAEHVVGLYYDKR